MMFKQSARLFVISVLAAGTVTFAQSSGADTYKSKCQMCHAADGSGSTPAGKSTKAISFSSPDIVKKSDEELIAATKNGKGKMPARNERCPNQNSPERVESGPYSFLEITQ